MAGYFDFWQIKSPVFTSIPDAQQIFISSTNRPITERLLFFTAQSSAILAVTGPQGHGKTAIARYIFHSLPMQSHEVLMFSLLDVEQRAGWLLPRFLQYFGAKNPGSQESVIDDVNAPASRDLLLRCFNQVFSEQRKLVIIILRAHLLEARDAFKELDILMQMQNLSGCQASFLLIGEPRLKQTLNEITWQQRLTYAGEIKPLNKNELFQYVQFRLRQANLNPDAFTREAIHQLYVLSHGKFSILNALCENAMLEAYLKQSKQITDVMVNKSAEITLADSTASPFREFSKTADPTLTSANILANVASDVMSDKREQTVKKERPLAVTIDTDPKPKDKGKTAAKVDKVQEGNASRSFSSNGEKTATNLEDLFQEDEAG